MVANLDPAEVAEWDARVPELQKTHAFEVLGLAVGEAVMAAERAGLTEAEIAEAVIGEMAIRPGYPNMIVSTELPA